MSAHSLGQFYHRSVCDRVWTEIENTAVVLTLETFDRLRTGIAARDSCCLVGSSARNDRLIARMYRCVPPCLTDFHGGASSPTHRSSQSELFAPRRKPFRNERDH